MTGAPPNKYEVALDDVVMQCHDPGSGLLAPVLYLEIIDGK